MQQLDKDSFEAAVNELVSRHDALRTYILPDGKQQIEPATKVGKFTLNIADGNDDEDAVELRSVLLSHFGWHKGVFKSKLHHRGGQTRIFPL